LTLDKGDFGLMFPLKREYLQPVMFSLNIIMATMSLKQSSV